MIPSNRAFPRSWTFRKFILRVLAHIISWTLSFMARLTEMSISPAKPLSSRTTEFTLKFYKIFSMFWTILNRHFTAIWTDEFFWIIRPCILSLIHGICTVLSSSKKGLLAFEAFKISINRHRIFNRLSKIWRVFISQLFIFFAFLEF